MPDMQHACLSNRWKNHEREPISASRPIDADAPVERRRRTGGRGADRSRKGLSSSKYLNLVNTMAKSVVLSDDALEAVHNASLTILEEIGMDVILPEARDRMKAAGADVTPGTDGCASIAA